MSYVIWVLSTQRCKSTDVNCFIKKLQHFIFSWPTLRMISSYPGRTGSTASRKPWRRAIQLWSYWLRTYSGPTGSCTNWNRPCAPRLSNATPGWSFYNARSWPVSETCRNICENFYNVGLQWKNTGQTGKTVWSTNLNERRRRGDAWTLNRMALSQWN